MRRSLSRKNFGIICEVIIEFRYERLPATGCTLLRPHMLRWLLSEIRVNILEVVQLDLRDQRLWRLSGVSGGVRVGYS